MLLPLHTFALFLSSGSWRPVKGLLQIFPRVSLVVDHCVHPPASPSTRPPSIHLPPIPPLFAAKQGRNSLSLSTYGWMDRCLFCECCHWKCQTSIKRPEILPNINRIKWNRMLILYKQWSLNQSTDLLIITRERNCLVSKFAQRVVILYGVYSSHFWLRALPSHICLKN